MSTPSTETTTNMPAPAFSYSTIVGKAVLADPRDLSETPYLPTSTYTDRPPKGTVPRDDTDVPNCATGSEVTSSVAMGAAALQSVPLGTTTTTPYSCPSTTIATPTSIETDFTSTTTPTLTPTPALLLHLAPVQREYRTTFTVTSGCVIAANGGRICSHAGTTAPITPVGLAAICTSLIIALTLALSRPKALLIHPLSTNWKVSALAVVSALVLAVSAVQPEEIAPRLYILANTTAPGPIRTPDGNGDGNAESAFPPMFGFAIAVWATAAVGAFLVVIALAAFFFKGWACERAGSESGGLDEAGKGYGHDSFRETVVESGHAGRAGDLGDVDAKIRGSGSSVVSGFESGEQGGRKL
jgi:hypothetical protein